MKKTTLLFTTILMLLIFNVSAQKVGFQMGANFSKIHFKEIPEAYKEEKMLIAPKLGFLFDIPLNENFFISTGLFTHLRGMRYESQRDIGDIYENDYETYDTDEYLIIWYINLPVNFGYKYDFGGAKFFAKTGPYLDLGVYSTILYKYDGNIWDNEKVKFGGIESFDDFEFVHLNRSDFGWNLESGIEVGRFQISAFYNLGFKNVINLPDLSELDGWGMPDLSVLHSKNRSFGMNVAILFGDMDGGGRGRHRGGWRR